MPFSTRLLVAPVLVAGGVWLSPKAPLRTLVADLISAIQGGSRAQLATAAPGAARLIASARGSCEASGPSLEALGAGEGGEWPEPAPEELASLDPAALGVVPAAATARLDALGRPSAEVAPAPHTLDPDRALAALGRETFVYAEPTFRAKRLGYLRAGALVHRGAKPVGHAGCADGWYAVEPEGYVCVGKLATLDLAHPIVVASRRRPDRTAPLPYEYGMSRFPTPPFYTKLPSAAEQRSVEMGLDKHLRAGAGKSWQEATLGPVPELLAEGKTSFTWGGGRHSPRSVYTGRALPKSGFAMLGLFENEGRSFGLSVDLDVMPLDRMQRVAPSEFRGVHLNEEVTLPVVFVRSRFAHLYDGDPRTGLKRGAPLGYRQVVPITGKSVRVGGAAYLETTGGGYLRDEHLTRINPMRNRPGWATPGRTWIDVSILAQTLVAYEGTTPVYATLVSTGADGLGDPKKTHSTIRGQFLIHTKHVTATMSGNEVGDEFDLRDVPYVQYFMEGYALHAAYWHESFGRPRSHGCINLSPIDAGWLFGWTDPPVPERWHGAMSLRQGTLVHIRP